MLNKLLAATMWIGIMLHLVGWLVDFRGTLMTAGLLVSLLALSAYWGLRLSTPPGSNDPA